MWFKLASHLHTPLQEVQQKTSSTEFLEWVSYLEQDSNAFHREDFYLAQVAAEVRRLIAKNPKAVKVQDFILKFVESRQEGKSKNWKERMAASKEYWMAVVGFGRKKG